MAKQTAMKQDKSSDDQSAIPKKTNRPKSEAPAVEKALDILELLSETPKSMTMNEMTSALGRTMGEIYRIVIYLNKRGYIARDPDSDRYGLTLRLFELSHRHNPTDRLLQVALPVLEKVAFQTEQSCHLAVLYQTSVLILASVPSPRPAGYSVRTGSVFPLLTTSSGVVILSFLLPEAQSRFLSSFGPTEQTALSQRIQSIKTLGYEERESGMVHGIQNLSAPVFDRSGVVAAITMGYVGQINQRTGPREALREIINGANEITTALGGNPFVPARSVPDHNANTALTD